MTSASGDVEVLVVGAGQAGLAAAHQLRRRGVEVLVVDAGSRIGDSWRSRWDSLRLFTPASANGLPGTAMAGCGRHPTKDEAADHLEHYADTHRLAVRLDSPVLRLGRDDDGFTAQLTDRTIRARAVVAATGAHRRAEIPDLASELDPRLAQTTSIGYRRPDALPEGRVLVVGAGNSGAEIAMDLAGSGRAVVLAGRDVGRIPQLGAPVFHLMRHIHTTTGPGRIIARAATGAGGDPLGRVDPRRFAASGVVRTGRITSVVDRLPATDDGQVTGLGSVVWCTGSRPDLRWMSPAVATGSNRVPDHCRGEVRDVPGLYLLGQPYQRTLASHLLGGVGADATVVARRVLSRLRTSGRET